MNTFVSLAERRTSSKCGRSWVTLVFRSLPILNPVLMDTQATAAVHGLQSIHTSGVAHRDLKPRHILVPKDQPGNVVFVDFTYSANDGRADSQPLYEALRESGMQNPDIRSILA